MMKLSFLTMVAVGVFCTAPVYGQTKSEIRQFNLAGPYAVSQPVVLDTVDVQGKAFAESSWLSALSLTSPTDKTFSGAVLPSLTDSKSVGLLTFYVNNTDYLKGKIEVKGPRNHQLFIDGAEASGDLSLSPEHHTFALRYLVEPNDTDSTCRFLTYLDTDTYITPSDRLELPTRWLWR